MTLVVLTPTPPLESILSASAPPLEKAMVLAAGKNIPVSVSPLGLTEGAAVEPAPIESPPVEVTTPAAVILPAESIVTLSVPPG